MNAITTASFNSESVYVSLVPAAYINYVWDEVKVFLEPAILMNNGRYTMMDVYEACLNDYHQLWIAFDKNDKIVGSVVTSLSKYPSKLVLTFLFIGGVNIHLWRDSMLEIITRFAKDNSCEAMEGFGRSGWIRMLKSYGFRKASVMLEKDI